MEVKTDLFQKIMCLVALWMMTASCIGIGLSIAIGHTVLTVLFAVLAMVFYNLSRWHKARAERGEQRPASIDAGQH
jgi:hypothetical protein